MTTADRVDTDPIDIEALAARVDDATAAADGLDEPGRTVARELRTALEDVHAAGLRAMVRRLRDDELTLPALLGLLDDPAVRLLLSLHGILRPPSATAAPREGNPDATRALEGSPHAGVGVGGGCGGGCACGAGGCGSDGVAGVAGTAGAVEPDGPGRAFVPLTAIGLRPPGTTP